MDSLNVPISSKGRRILPPLCFWRGERLTVKDNSPIYNLGNLQESSLLSVSNNLKENPKDAMNIKEQKKQKENSDFSKKQNENKQILLPESNKNSNSDKSQPSPRASKKSPKIKDTDNIKSMDSLKKHQKSTYKKRKLAQKIMFSSSNSTEEEEQRVSPRKHMCKSWTNENADPKVRSPSRYSLRKRSKTETCSLKIFRGNTSRDNTIYHSPTQRSKMPQMTCIYYQDIPESKDFLSENEVSII